MTKRLFQLVGLVLLIALVLFPVWLMAVQAFIPSFDARQVVMYAEPIRLFSSEPDIEQIKVFLSRHKKVGFALCRDLLWALVSASLQCAVSLVSGYLLAKYRDCFSACVFTAYVLTMVVPLQMYLIPTYRIGVKIGLGGSPILLYLPVAFSPLGTVFMRQIFIKLPDEYIDAFRLEDNRMTRLITRILLPVGFPALCVLFLLSFTEAWSMVEQPLILISDRQQYPLGMMLYRLYTDEPDIIFAASLFALLPVFFFLVCVVIIGLAGRFRKNRFLQHS